MMRISRFCVYQVDIPVRRRFTLSDGSATSLADVTIVKLVTDLGLDGWGEITPLSDGAEPGYGESVRSELEQLAQRVLGWEIETLDDLALAFDDTPQESARAWSAIDVAGCDLMAKTLSIPAYEVLGGSNRGRVPIDKPADAKKLSVAEVGGLTGALRQIADVETVHIGESAGTTVALAALAHLAMAAPTQIRVSVEDFPSQNHFGLGGDVTTVSQGYLTVSGQPGVITEPNLGILGHPIATYEG